MRAKTSFPVKTILAWLCAAALFSFGFDFIDAQYAVRLLQGGPINLSVTPLAQSLSTSCGEAAITMVYNYAHPESPVSEQIVIEYAKAQGDFTPRRLPFTSPADMVDIARHYTPEVSSGAVVSAGQGLALLTQKLESGQPVIIDVTSLLYDPDSGAHFVVVTGLSDDPNRNGEVIVHFNNPLTGQNETARWLGQEGIWNAWRNNDDPGGAGWWMVIAAPQT